MIHGGGIVCANAAGYAVPGSADATLAFLGRAEESVDNSAGRDGARFALVRSDGEFQWKSAPGADAVTEARIGRTCWILDDETVAGLDGAGTRPPAGIVTGIAAEPDGPRAWVRPAPAAAAAGSPAALAARVQALEASPAELSVTLDAAAIRGLDAARHVIVPAPGAGAAVAVEEIRLAKRGGIVPAEPAYAAVVVMHAAQAGGIVNPDGRLALYLATGASWISLANAGDVDRIDLPGQSQAAYLSPEDTPVIAGAFAVGTQSRTAAGTWQAVMANVASVTLKLTVRYRVVIL